MMTEGWNMWCLCAASVCSRVWSRYFDQFHHCGLVGSAPALDGTGCEFDFWQFRIYIPCSLSLRLLGSLQGSLDTYGLTQKLCLKKKRQRGRWAFAQTAAADISRLTMVIQVHEDTRTCGCPVSADVANRLVNRGRRQPPHSRNPGVRCITAYQLVCRCLVSANTRMRQMRVVNFA